ncbi:SycD/LcrH family type III secretion system chaperone [Paludibacterium purpuratum]|uniref:Secretion system chaperone SscA n=1 Tax=Paludibacterium purpuratum TaxID=1144873 RepID=A0A4R7B153_9NEIS|nr:SycD/LcrH family type III secretion system chaperone [Paludibacterium purpuratum]TDR76639.1 secretion system chaperone SscA [Paludibacterium purpuratum]
MRTTATLAEYLHQGVTLQALLDIDPADLDTVYASACQLFERQDFAGAKKPLVLLTRLSHWQFDYWLALGLTCQRLGEHEEAIHSFSQSAKLCMEDPRSAYFAGLSLHVLKQHASARLAFDTVLALCASKPQHQALKQKARQMLDLCREECP